MRKTTIASLVALAVVAVLAVPADAIYAKRHGASVTCTATGMAPRSEGQPKLMTWDCDGQEHFSDPVIGELRLLKVGETVRCVKWRSLILGAMFGDVISNCTRV